MVELEKQNNTSKVEDLLGQNDTYRTLAADPINKQKQSKQWETWGTTLTKECIQQEQGFPSSFYGLPKIHKKDTPLDSQYPAGLLSHVWWLRN